MKSFTAVSVLAVAAVASAQSVSRLSFLLSTAVSFGVFFLVVALWMAEPGAIGSIVIFELDSV